MGSKNNKNYSLKNMNKNLLIVGLTVMVNLLFAQSNGDKPSENTSETKVKQIPWQMISSSDESIPVSKIQIGDIYLNTDSLTQIPDVQASFPGGQNMFLKYVRSNFVWPSRCIDCFDDFTEPVKFNFIINEIGKISNIQISFGSNHLTKEEFEMMKLEFERVLKKSPRWIPGQVNGRFVRSLKEVNFEILNIKGDESKNQVREPIGLPLDYLDSDSEKIELKPNVKASFPGGEAKFIEYIQRAFQYPVRCQDYGINGSVVLRFIVDSKGQISDIKVIAETKTCPEFTTEAIRILRKSPRWVPGQNNGQFIKSYREIPIRLSVQ